MPDQQLEGDGRDLPPTVAGADDAGGRRPELLSVALFVFFIALLLVVGAMTLLPVVLR